MFGSHNHHRELFRKIWDSFLLFHLEVNCLKSEFETKQSEQQKIIIQIGDSSLGPLGGEPPPVISALTAITRSSRSPACGGGGGL